MLKSLNPQSIPSNLAWISFPLLLPLIKQLKCETKTKTEPQTTPLINDAEDHNLKLQNPTTAIALVLTSWLHGRRLRYLLLALCLSLLIPIVFASILVICVMEICFPLYRRRLKSGPPQDLEGGGGEAVDLDLLERYLDDPLGLVLEIYVNVNMIVVVMKVVTVFVIGVIYYVDC